MKSKRLTTNADVILLSPKSAALPIPEHKLLHMYRTMVAIRLLDERALKLQRSGRIGFCVTALGEEATQVATAAAFNDEDWIVPSYRQYGVAMYRGATHQQIFDHLVGNANDTAKGRMMPEHFSFKHINFVSNSSVIGTQIAHATGIAMAAKLKKDSVVVGTYFGDGATSSNDFNSALNFAGVYQAPVVFFCVNNQFAISLPVSQQTACPTMAQKAMAYGFEGVRVDGNDLMAIYEASSKAVQKARSGGGPTLIELLTYRRGPHSSSDDPTRYRETLSQETLDATDPILRTKALLCAHGLWSEQQDIQLIEDTTQALQEAAQAALKAPKPTWDTLFSEVYEAVPPMLQAQYDALMAHESHLELNAHGEFPL